MTAPTNNETSTYKLHHPLWTHLPAAACVIAIAVVLSRADYGPRVPMQFNAAGEPVRWGSPVELWLWGFGVPLLLVVGSAILDELHARQERCKQFNWVALLDELTVGVTLALMVAITQLSREQPNFSVPWVGMLMLGSGPALLAGLLEWLRPCWPGSEKREPSYELSATEVERMNRASEHWVYWEAQNPAWLRVLIVVTVVPLSFGTVTIVQDIPWLTPLPLAGAVFLVLVYGGIRVTVSPQQLVLRVGFLGIPLRRIPLKNVESVEAISFSPLADFGGWGPGRYSFRLGAWGFYLRGTRGAMIKTRTGSKCLIGSDTPERLVAYLQTAMGMAQTA